MNDFLRSKLSEMEARVSEIASLLEGTNTPPREQQADSAADLWPLADEVGRLARAAFVLLSIEHDPNQERTLWRHLQTVGQEYERITGAALPGEALPDAEEVRRLQQERSQISDRADVLVFLCHSSGDKPYVRRLERRLRSDGIQTWLDESNLLPGQDWDHEIRAAVRRAAAVVVCLSHGAVTKSGYLQKEIRFVLDVADEQPPGTIFVIPARLEDCEVPERLRLWHWVDLFRRGGYARLRAAIQEVGRSKSA